MQKENILKEIKIPEDRLLVAKLLDKIEERNTKNKIVVTDFMNLHEKRVCELVLRGENVERYVIAGGYEEAERAVIILYPAKLDEEYLKLTQWICIIRIKFQNKKEKYSHREYLGGLMKLGLKRKKIGDILVFEDGADIIVKSEISNFLIGELGKLKRFDNAIIEYKEITEVRKNVSNKEELQIIVSSFRVDTIIAELLHSSRTKACSYIKECRIIINGLICENGAKKLIIGDIITIRGKGRYIISEEMGYTKKDNVRLRVLKYC